MTDTKKHKNYEQESSGVKEKVKRGKKKTFLCLIHCPA